MLEAYSRQDVSFEQIVAVAVVYERKELSYVELNRRART